MEENSTYYYDYDYYWNVSEDYQEFVTLCENVHLHLFGAKLTPALYSLIFIFSLIGNILVLWILIRYEKLKTMANIFILNLVCSDLIFACTLPFWAVDHTHEWIFGKAMCKIISMIFFIGYYSGIMLLTLMTLDRYFAVVHALTVVRIRKVRYVVVACLVVWCISILAAVPEMIFADVDQTFSCVTIYPKDDELIWRLLGCYQQNFLFFLTPFIIIVLSYYKIFNTVVKCRTRKKHKAVKVIFCIVVVFFLCWAPYNVVIFLLSLTDLQVPFFTRCSVANQLTHAYLICRTIAYFHCCLNPLFYVFVGTKFREHLIGIASKWLPDLKVCKEIDTSSTKQLSSHTYSNIGLHLQTVFKTEA
ncbi:chemokine XC receptor 1-like [Rhinoraja longicauda]